MTRRVIFLTHADVVMDPAVPVPDWSLSARGRDRHAAFATSPVLSAVTAIRCSRERKAVEAAELTGAALGLAPVQVEALGENDRSATGYLPPDLFEAAADRFFADPESSIDGWEPAAAAQARIVGAVRGVIGTAPPGDCLIVGHGGTAALLRCHLKAIPITRAEDQPPVRGGCWFSFDADMASAPSDWMTI